MWIAGRLVCCLGLVVGLLQNWAGITRVSAAEKPMAHERVAQQAATQAILSLPIMNANVGDTLTIAVSISTSVPSRSAQAGFSFNPAVLQCTTRFATEGDYYKTWAVANGLDTIMVPTPKCDNTKGDLSVGGVAILGGNAGEGPSGTSGTLFSMSFTVVGSGVSPLILDPLSLVKDATYQANSLTLTTFNGAVAVGETLTPSPTVSPTGGSAPTDTPTPSQGAATSTLSPTPVPSATGVIPCAAEDVNGDGVVDIGDVGLIGAHWGEHGAPGWIPEDVNRDGVIDISDVGLVGVCWGTHPGTSTATATLVDTGTPTLDQTVSATAITATPPPNTPSPDQTVTNTPITVTSTSSPPVSTASSTPVTPSATPTPVPSVSSSPSDTPLSSISFTTTSSTDTPTIIPTPVAVMSVISPTQALAMNANVDIDINLDMGSTTSRGAQFGLTYNPAVLNCLSADGGSFYDTWASENGGQQLVFPQGTCDNTNGILTDMGLSIIGGTPSGPSGSGTIAIVHFKTKANGVSQITLGDVAVLDVTLPKPRKVSYALINGQVQVGGVLPSQTPSMTVSPTITPTGTLPTSTPTLSPTTTYSPTPTLSPSFTNTSGPTVSPTNTSTGTATSSSWTATYTYSPSPGFTPITPVPTIASASRVGFSPAQVLTNVGQTFSVDVVFDLDQASRDGQAAFSFNPSVIQCSSVTEGTFYKSWAQANGASTFLYPQPQINNTSGTISLIGIALLGGASQGTGGHIGGPSGAGSFVTLQCTGQAVGVSSLTITQAEVHNDVRVSVSGPLSPLQISIESGQVFVGVTPTPTPYGQSGPTPLPTLPGSSSSGTQSSQATGTAGTPGTGTPTPIAGTGTAAVGSTGGGSSASAAGSQPPDSLSTDIFQQVLADSTDSNGILSQDILFQEVSQPWMLKLGAKTQALASDHRPLLTLTIQAVNPAPKLGKGLVLIGSAYDLEPNGATFNPPMTFVLQYDRSKLPKGISESGLSIATFDPKTGSWVLLASQVDLKAQTVSARIAHTSIYAILGRPSGINWVLVVGITLLGEVLLAFGIVYYLRRRRAQAAQVVEAEVVPTLPSPTGDHGGES
jgi:hypothetical protein